MQVEIELDSSISHLQDVKANIKYFKDVNDHVHRKREEGKREDILCFQMVVENM